MVQIIPQDVGLAARIAQGVLPPLGEGFQQGAQRGIEREQGLREREQQRQIDMEAALEQERRQRQMNLDAMQQSGIAQQYPGLASLLQFKIGTGQPADLGPFEDLEARKAKWNFITGGPGPFGGTQQPGQFGHPGADAVSNTIPGPLGVGTQTYAPAADAPSPKEVTGRMGGYAPIAQENNQAQDYAIGRPPVGPVTTLWDSFTPDQRQRWQMIDPEEAQRMQQASEQEKEKLTRDRAIEEQEFSGLDTALDSFYKDNKFEGSEWETPKKELYRQTRGMGQVEAQRYVRDKMIDIARDVKSFRSITNKPEFRSMDPVKKDMQRLQELGKKFENLGLGEYYRGKLAEVFPTPYPIEAVMNPLDKEYQKKLDNVKGGPSIGKWKSALGIGGGMIAKAMENALSTPPDEARKNLKDTLRESIPKGQSLYATRQHLAKKGIPPAWLESTVRELMDEGVDLNSRQRQELDNVGMTNAEYLNVEKVQPWFSGLKGIMKNVAMLMFTEEELAGEE